jgi:hypothetical protein
MATIASPANESRRTRFGQRMRLLKLLVKAGPVSAVALTVIYAASAAVLPAIAISTGLLAREAVSLIRSGSDGLDGLIVPLSLVGTLLVAYRPAGGSARVLHERVGGFGLRPEQSRGAPNAGHIDEFVPRRRGVLHGPGVQRRSVRRGSNRHWAGPGGWCRRRWCWPTRAAVFSTAPWVGGLAGWVYRGFRPGGDFIFSGPDSSFGGGGVRASGSHGARLGRSV